MRPGTVIRLVHQPVQRQVDVGALAIVVDGKKEFPKLYDELLSKVGVENMDEFVWVKWRKKPKYWHGQPDGAYSVSRFEKVVKGNVVNTSRRVLN